MDLVALVREAVWVHQQIAPQRIAFQTQEAVLRIEADRDRLSRVVANLIANARAYSPENSEIRINLTEQEDGRRSWAVLTMTDQGIGIPARDLPHIFEQFYRGTNVPATTPGNGMGLCTANRTVEQQGGEIHIDSIEGEGTTVTVRLPMD
jgi:two-component system phosphate regulon sensor histidine kinase PhoR